MTIPTQKLIWQRPLIQTSDADAVAHTLTRWFEDNHYSSYDPFAGGLGAPVKLKDRLKLFVAPSPDGWTSLVIDPDNPLDPAAFQLLSTVAPVIVVGVLADSPPVITTFRDQQAHPAPDGLTPFLKEDITPEQFQTAWTAMQTADTAPPVTDDGSSSGPVNWLIKRMTKRYVKQMEAEGADIDAIKAAAQSAISQSNDEIDGQRADWQALQVVFDCLNVRADWTYPTWKVLNKAYSVARQRDNRPNAVMMPGDEEALQAVPNALDYRPLFYARAVPS